MYANIAVFVAGLAAVAQAAPVAQVSQSTNWQGVWSSQLASMASVQSHMGNGKAGSGARTTVVLQTSTTTSAVTATLAPKKAAGGNKATVTGNAAQPTLTGAFTAQATTTAATTAAASTGGASLNNDVANPSAASVTNSAAWNGQDSTGPSPTDTYRCYPTDGSATSAPASSFPPESQWSSFSALWTQNTPLLQQGCANLGYSPSNTDQQNTWIMNSIVEVAGKAKVDPRVILAVVMQESHGCLAVGSTANGVTNPGLMQSHDGSSFVGDSASASAQQASITQMIVDGTQGTSSGDGLVQLINQFGNVYTAARAYNSGSNGVTASNLNAGNGATGSYVNDISNRLTGWVFNPGTSPTCPGESN